MVEVTASRSGGHHTVIAKGHATGSEKVCAAVSAILYGLAGYAHNNKYVTLHTYKAESGDFELDYTGESQSRGAFDMAIIALLQIEDGYKEYITVKFCEN